MKGGIQYDMEKKPISGTGGGTASSGQPVAPRKTSPLYQGRQASPPVVREREGGRERREGEREGRERREGGREREKGGGRERREGEEGGREEDMCTCACSIWRDNSYHHQQQPLYYLKRVTFQPVNAVNFLHLKSFTIGHYSVIPCKESALNYTLCIVY